jgi:AcrR family transcriptional regulator
VINKPKHKINDPVARKRPARSRDPEGSRRALILAAAQLFNTVGFYGTDTNKIAVAAGYTPGTFYTHFKDKREIFLEVYRNWVASELSEMVAVVNRAGGSKQVAQVVLKHHRKWRTFRASLRALYATDEVVHQARLEQRRRQMVAITKGGASSKGNRSSAEILTALLILEVIADFIADGDVKMMGVREADMFKYMVDCI